MRLNNLSNLNQETFNKIMKKCQSNSNIQEVINQLLSLFEVLITSRNVPFDIYLPI